jgi:ferric-dicitrate binding protein FerR (iron transport regulator)
MTEINYSNFDLADFAANEDFVSWVIHPDEQNEAFWSNWRKKNPEKTKMLHEARLLVLLMKSRQVRMHDDQKEVLWKRIQEVTVDKEQQLEQRQKMLSDQQPGFPFFKVAASIAFILFSALAVYIFNWSSVNNQIVENPKGKKSMVYLEDGTKVWLNSDSKLSYSKSYTGKDSRTVELEGEAFFDVAENPEKPFIVKTSDLQIIVLGTAFNVKAFPSEKQIETTLVRGRVKLEVNNDQRTILNPNEQAIYLRDSDKISVSPVQAEKIISWKEGELLFEDLAFSEIELALERWYGVEIILKNEAGAKCRFSSRFQNEPITKVLDLLKATSNIEYVINGKTITINGSLCHDITNSR